MPFTKRTVNPIGNFPAGIECVAAKGDTVDILSMVWLVPGGKVVYVHAACTLADTHDESFWERTTGRIQQHLRAAKGVTTFPDMALSDQPSQYQERPYVPATQAYEGTRNAVGAFDLHCIFPAA